VILDIFVVVKETSFTSSVSSAKGIYFFGAYMGHMGFLHIFVAGTLKSLLQSSIGLLI
jgi:NAD kinase